MTAATADTFSVNVAYGITYNTIKPVPIPDVIKSLQSLEKLLQRTPAFVEKAYKEIKIVETKVFVSKIESGSLIEDFVVQYVFKGRENCDDAKKVWDNIMKDNTAIRTVVAMGVGSLMTLGVMQIIPTGHSTTQIEAYNNTIINMGGTVDLKADDFKAVLDSIKDKKSLSKEAVDAIKPAKADPGATISVSGITALDVPAAVIEEAPAEYTPPQPKEREVNYNNVDLVVYASDRDKTESGWAGIIPTVVDKRTPISLDVTINPTNLHGRLKVKADVIVHERYVASKKKYEAKKIEVLKTN